MIISYNEYRNNLNESYNHVDDYNILLTIIQNIYEFNELSYNDVEDLDTFINESIDNEINILDVILENQDLIDTYEVNNEIYFSLTKRAIRLYESYNNGEINEFVNPFKKKEEPKGFLGHMSSGMKGIGKGIHGASKIAGGLGKQYLKSKDKQAKIADKSKGRLMKHDYKMAKLSAKSKDNAFDSYSKLASTDNARY